MERAGHAKGRRGLGILADTAATATLSSTERHLGHLPTFLSKQDPEFARLFEVVDDLPIDDTHCHLITDQDAFTTPQRYLERISLAGFAVPSYFPPGIYARWVNGDEGTRYDLDRKYGIQDKVSRITFDLSHTIFIKFLVKEMAQFYNATLT
ncbi:hypothetical protein [Mesorhizobium sp.]|uniref:hypothetical protein n=1 Tax=Mesorhizobium sp. TaxID=1871066 RepID=UPI00257F7F49|nr:hypothetical protein [Mesorhizobium sp.]